MEKKSIVADITICPLSMTGLRVGIESKIADRCVTHRCSWWDRDPGTCAILTLAANYRTLVLRSQARKAGAAMDQTQAAAGGLQS